MNRNEIELEEKIQAWETNLTRYVSFHFKVLLIENVSLSSLSLVNLVFVCFYLIMCITITVVFHSFIIYELGLLTDCCLFPFLCCKKFLLKKTLIINSMLLIHFDTIGQPYEAFIQIRIFRFDKCITFLQTIKLITHSIFVESIK